MSASPEMNENFVNDLRELMAKYNIQHAQMNVELINSNNNKDNDTNSVHTDKVEISKEATPTLSKAHVNVVITNNDVKCPPLLSPNKTNKNTEINDINTNTKINDATDAENDTKTNGKALPLMETNKLSVPVTHALHQFTNKSSTQGNAEELELEEKEKNIERLENIRPYVVSQPAAPLSEIPRKQDVLPHSHSVSERRTHLCSPHPMSGVNIPCTTTSSTATAPINTEANNVKENGEVKGQTETRTGEQRQQQQKKDNAVANISQSVNNANAPKATSPVPSTAINKPLKDNTGKEPNTHSSEKSTVEFTKEIKATTNTTEGSSTLHNMMADAAASGMAIPEDLQLHLAQEEQRQKRIAILNSFVGKSALLQDKAEREKMNAEASNSIRRTSNTNKNGTFANRFMFGANRLSVSSAADANSKNNSANDVNSSENESQQQASQQQQQQQQQEMVKNDKLPPITYTSDCHTTSSLPSSSHHNSAISTTVTNKEDNNDGKDLTNAHVSNAAPASLSPHSPTQPSEKVSVEIDAKLFTDICRENSRQAARLRPHLSESFAPITSTTTTTNTGTKANQSGRGSACGLKEMLKEQQNMELQSREELLKHAELMAKAKAVIDHADHIEYKPHSPENKMHHANGSSINSTMIGTTTSASLPYSLTRNPHNDITVAQNNAKVAEANAKNNYNTPINATTTTTSPKKQMSSVNEKTTPPPPTTKVNSNAESAKSTNNNSSSNCNSNNRTPNVNNALEEKQNKRKSQIELVSITLPQANTEARSEAINRFAKEPTLIQYLQGKDKYDALLASQQKELTEHQKETKDYKELVNQAVQFNKKIGIS